EALQGVLAANTRIERVGVRRAQKGTPGQEHTTVAEGSGAATVADAGLGRRVTGAFSLLTRLKHHKLIMALAVSTLAVVVAYWYFGRAVGPSHVALTERDTILLADFVNTTGDAVFDGTLKQGLAVQLEQSPYLNIFPEERARETLRLLQ